MLYNTVYDLAVQYGVLGALSGRNRFYPRNPQVEDLQQHWTDLETHELPGHYRIFLREIIHEIPWRI